MMNFAALSLFSMRGTLQVDLAAFTPYLLITSPPLHYSSLLGSPRFTSAAGERMCSSVHLG